MAVLMLFQGSKHDENRVQMASGPRGANCTSQTSLQVSRKLGDGAFLLHGSDRGHLQICRPLNLRSWVDASAAHPREHAGKISGMPGANARSVTCAFPTTEKPVDTGKARNVLKTERIAGKAGFPALGDFLNLRKLP